MAQKDIYILGVSGNFSANHNGAAASITKNSDIIAAVEEERLIRIKHAPGRLPERAIRFCLSEAGIGIRDVDYLAFYINSYANITKDLQEYMEFHFGYCPEIRLVDHHEAHSAATYLISGLPEAKILTIDYSGDGVSTTLAKGVGRKIERVKEYRKPNSLGIFYGMITQFLGFDMNSDEYKVMGLASYGSYDQELQEKMDRIVKVTSGSYELDPETFYASPTQYQHKYTPKLVEILGPSRKTDEPVTQREKDIAYAAQKKLEEACLELLKDLSDLVPSRNLCLAGGTTMNCVMNSVLLRSDYVDTVFIPSAADDSGTSLGAAISVANSLGFAFEKLKTSYLGPSYSNESIKGDLDALKLRYTYMDEEQLVDYVSDSILQGKIMGWLQGKLEFGARALGNRSILANPQDPTMKDKINKLIKFRETFRPFAPSVPLENASDYFADIAPSPYMNLTFQVTTDKLPAITHVDNTARVQTVTEDDNALYYKLLKKVGEKSGIPVILNTSLNIMGQPIACSPKDALTVFGATGMDIMVLGNYVVAKG